MARSTDDSRRAIDLASELTRIWTQGRSSAVDHAFVPDTIPQFLQSPLLANLITEHSRVVAQVIDMRRFKSIWVSSNVTAITGFTTAEINAQGVIRFLTNLGLSELLLHVANGRRMAKIDKRMPPRVAFCSSLINSGLKTKSGERRRIMCKNFALEWDEHGKQIYQLFVWTDASSLFKSNRPFWRHQWGPANAPLAVLTYHPDKDKFLEQELFSTRELEVLERIAAGASSKDIAAELEISSQTVDNHRKNLIARTQTMSTEGLLEVQRWLSWR